MTGSPRHWVSAPLSDLLREPLRNGHSAKASGSERGVRTLTLTAVTEGNFSEVNTKVTSADPRKVDSLWLEPDDILIERSNTPELVGTARLFPGPTQYAIFPDLLIRVRLVAQVSPKLLEAYFQTGPVRSYFRRSAKGISGSMPKISQGVISDLTVPLPPSGEQTRIVSALDSYFTRLDAAEQALKRVQTNLKRYRASVLKAAVEGRLVPTEAELARREGREYEPAEKLLERILVERRKRWEEAELEKMRAKGKELKDDKWKVQYVVPAGPEVSDPPELPDGWCWATTDQLFHFVTSGSRGWAKYYSEQGAMFLRMGNLDHDTIALDLSEVQRVTPPPGAEGMRTRVMGGDILISITADVGMVGLIPDELGEAYINQHVALARPVPGAYSRHLAWYLASESGGKQQLGSLERGATKVGLGLTDIRSVLLPLPPRAEQERMVAEIEQKWDEILAMEESARRSILRISRLRQSILKWAFEGKLVDQDPDDEPASVLLERIRAERAAAKPVRRRRGTGRS